MTERWYTGHQTFLCTLPLLVPVTPHVYFSVICMCFPTKVHTCTLCSDKANESLSHSWLIVHAPVGDHLYKGQFGRCIIPCRSPKGSYTRQRRNISWKKHFACFFTNSALLMEVRRAQVRESFHRSRKWYFNKKVGHLQEVHWCIMGHVAHYCWHDILGP